MCFLCNTESKPSLFFFSLTVLQIFIRTLTEFQCHKNVHNKLLFTRGFSFMGNHEKDEREIFTFVFKARTFVFSELEGSKRQKQKQKIARVIFQEDALIEHFAIPHV